MTQPRIEIVSFSGFGHTQKQAEAVLEGARTAGAARAWTLPENGEVSDDLWDALDAADCIVFGSPTYMGGPCWQMKKFAEESSGRWMNRAWQDKLAGGFTNSGSPTGDKGQTMTWLWTLASQHGMIWASLGQEPASEQADGHDDRNWLGASTGAMAQSPSDAGPDVGPRAGDLKSAYDYGQRLAELAAIFANEREEQEQQAA